MEQVCQEVRQLVCYDVLVQRMDQELLDELVGLIVETLCDKARTIRIGSHDYPAELVQERMRQIDSFCLEYVCACLRKSNPSIRNIKQYLLMALFNAPVTISHYYYYKAQNALNDWYTGGIANENLAAASGTSLHLRSDWSRTWPTDGRDRSLGRRFAGAGISIA